MKTIIKFLILIAFINVEMNSAEIMQINIEGGIGTATASYVQSAINEAEEGKFKAVLIVLNTPGGLLEATRGIVHSILESEIPVIVYVAPGGARAGSAGVFITLSANIAAMAEGTNIGAAHPVGLGGDDADATMGEKIENDAAAFVRTIAQNRGRNVEWAERAVRESISSTEIEAFQSNVIDVIAPDIDSLLRYSDGKIITIKNSSNVLKLRSKEIFVRKQNWRESILSFLSDPNIAYVLILVGVFGIFFEVKSPGSIFPGVFGGISILIAAYSLQMMPINMTGLLLIILGIILFIIEIFVASYGILTIGGVISFFIGSVMLIDSPLEFMQISMGLIITVTVMIAIFVVLIAYFGIKAQFKKLAPGETNFEEETGIAIADFKSGDEGNIKVRGEIWKAISDEDISKNDKLKIISIDRFVLKVKRI